MNASDYRMGEEDGFLSYSTRQVKKRKEWEEMIMKVVCSSSKLWQSAGRKE